MQVTIDFVNKRIRELYSQRDNSSMPLDLKSVKIYMEMLEELELLEEIKEKIDPWQDFYRGGEVKPKTLLVLIQNKLFLYIIQ